MLLFSIFISNGEDHVLFVLIQLTRVLCPFGQVLFALSSLASLFNRSAVRICSSLFLFSDGVFSTLIFFILLFSGRWLNLSRLFGFTRLSKKQLSLSLLFLFRFPRCHPRSQDEILSQWWSVVTPRDRCARCLPVIRCCCLVICLRVMHFISCHHVHRICIRVRLRHPSTFPVVHFAIQRSYVLRCSLLPLFMCGC